MTSAESERAAVAAWQPIETAPRGGGDVLLLLGETIPDHPDIRVGSFIAPDGCLDLGYREYARFGGWLIWNSACDWFMIDVIEPRLWMPIPPPPSDHHIGLVTDDPEHRLSGELNGHAAADHGAGSRSSDGSGASRDHLKGQSDG